MIKSNTEEKLTRKERERLFRRKEIMLASIPLFAEKGFMNTTLDEIAEAAEFGKGTLYHYFDNKEELYISLFTYIVELYGEISIRTAEETDNFIDFVYEYTKGLFIYSFKNPYKYLILAREFAPFKPKTGVITQEMICDKGRPGRSVIEGKIEEAIENMILVDLPIQRITEVYGHFIHPHLYHLIEAGDYNNINVDEEVDFLLNILFNGILIKKEQRTS